MGEYFPLDANVIPSFIFPGYSDFLILKKYFLDFLHIKGRRPYFKDLIPRHFPLK